MKYQLIATWELVGRAGNEKWHWKRQLSIVKRREKIKIAWSKVEGYGHFEGGNGRPTV